MSTARPARIVDCHVHFWDPGNSDWYPYLGGGKNNLNMGDTTDMNRLFNPSLYAAESSGWNIEKFVNVAAATGSHSVDETLHIDSLGYAAGIVGGLPPTESVGEAIALLDKQMTAPGFRGVRPMGQSKDPLPAPEVLTALAERGLAFDLMARTPQLLPAAEGLAGHGSLTVVVEHTGWPMTGTDEEFATWKNGLDALASVGPNVVCKLSGLAMPLGAMTVDALRPWIEFALDVFGVDRCMFASNFPVDGLHGSLDQLWSTYNELTSDLSNEDRDKLFAVNAERTYKI